MTTVVAEHNPHAKVLGIDLSSILPKTIPPNVTFRRADVMEDWTATYDYIHIRQMVYDVCNWEYLLGQAYK
jgi:hypothetical protein